MSIPSRSKRVSSNAKSCRLSVSLSEKYSSLHKNQSLQCYKKVKPAFSNLKCFSIPDPADPESREEEITKIPYRTKVKLTAAVENLDDGDKVRLRIYEESWSDEMSYRVQEIIEVKECKVEFEWKASCCKERLAELTEDDELKYVFNLECDGVESDDIITLEFDRLKPGLKYTLEDKTGEYKIFEDIPFSKLIYESFNENQKIY